MESIGDATRACILVGPYTTLLTDWRLWCNAWYWYRNSVRLSVRPSVNDTLVLCQGVATINLSSKFRNSQL